MKDEDWTVGDKAAYDPDATTCGLCDDNDRLQIAAVWEVSRVVPFIGEPCGLFLQGLDPLEGRPFCSCCFRKIRPDRHEGEAEDWALILEQVKRKVGA